MFSLKQQISLFSLSLEPVKRVLYWKLIENYLQHFTSIKLTSLKLSSHYRVILLQPPSHIKLPLITKSITILH